VAQGSPRSEPILTTSPVDHNAPGQVIHRLRVRESSLFHSIHRFDLVFRRPLTTLTGQAECSRGLAGQLQNESWGLLGGVSRAATLITFAARLWAR